MSTLEEVKAQLGVAISKAEQAISGATTIGKDTDEALQYAHTATQGSGHPKVDEALGHLRTGKSKAEDAIVQLNAAIDAINNYMASL